MRLTTTSTTNAPRACGLIAAALALAISQTSTANHPPTFLGNMSCTAVSCHGDSRRETVSSSAAHFYWDRDPHQLAGSVLRNSLSRQIMERLGRMENAWQSQACLDCHAPTNSPTSGHAKSLAEGVSCEDCHGPASQWLSLHRSAEWRRSDLWSVEQKARLGFRDTKDLPTRIDLCADCHVGNQKQMVTHDLIAAGHPRLTFEFSAYQNLMPRHWREKDQRANEGRDWLLGQIVAADHELEILAAAAQKEDAAWPELAQYDCFACHHDLQSDSWRQQRVAWNLRPGELPWGTWSLGLVAEIQPQLPGAGPDFQQQLERLAGGLLTMQPSRTTTLADIPVLRSELKQLTRRLSSVAWSSDDLTRIRDMLLHDSETSVNRGWDRTAQLYLAVVALEKGVQAARGGKNRVPEPKQLQLTSLRDLLSFDKSFSSPQRFELNIRSIQDALEGYRSTTEFRSDASTGQ